MRGKEENFESRRSDKLSNEWLKVRKTIFLSKVVWVLDFVRSVSFLGERVEMQLLCWV
jgi:hypothetical protein